MVRSICFLIQGVILFFLSGFTATASKDSLKIIVKEDRADCMGVSRQSCLQVKYSDSEDWELFYDQIKGFKYKPGYRYTLWVYRTQRSDVPADASLYSYRLKRIVQRQKIDNKPRAHNAAKADVWNFVSGKKWKLLQINGILQNKDAYISFDKENNRINGNGGCNGFFGSFTATDSTITFSEIASTLMACIDPEITQLESDFFRQLRNHTFTFDVADQTLNFYRNDSLVLLFGLMEKPYTKEVGKESGTLQGTVIWKEGNHMPSIGGHQGKSNPVSREIVIYTLTGQQDVEREGFGGFYKSVHSKMIKSVWADKDGKYSVQLPPGSYSVFVKENGMLYANRGDGQGSINPVTIESGTVTNLDIVIDYKAAY